MITIEQFKDKIHNLSFNFVSKAKMFGLMKLHGVSLINNKLFSIQINDKI